jgi:hypothetical protein
MTRKVRKRKGKNSDKHWVGTECLGSVFNHLLSIKLEIFFIVIYKCNTIFNECWMII